MQRLHPSSGLAASYCFLTLVALLASPTQESFAAGELRKNRLAEMDKAIFTAIGEERLPGGVLWFWHEGTLYKKAYGKRALVPAVEEMTENTLFDMASLTKVMTTTPAIMLLVERGKIKLDDPAAAYIPEFQQNGKERVTVKQLMTHTSGLRPGLPATPAWTGYDKAIELACAEKLAAPPGTVFRYSDINFILLGEIVRRVSGLPLNFFAEKEIYKPLKMNDTGFQPDAVLAKRTAPTENLPTGLLRGVVHDPTARRMGGVAGHAGLFSTAADVGRYAQMMLRGGALDGARIFKSETVRLMTSPQSETNLATRRGLGWDIDSSYAGPRGKHFPVGSYGHTGWTGTSLWIDPFSKTIVAFLSNRNHPTEDGSVLALRHTLGTLAAEAIPDFNFAYVEGALERREDNTPRVRLATATVRNGIDQLKEQKFAPLKGLRLGLITNHTGADRERNPTIDLLFGAEGVQLKALFSPEHGIRGLMDENVKDATDEKTGLPIYSLYGVRRTPAPEQLQELDALLFDIQDIGCRFYTYISTMGNCMEAAAKAKLKYFVLDRANPINGVVMEGPILFGESSFTGYHTIPVRHGMTVGELAKMFNAERKFGADLTVVPLQGWRRDFYYDQTSLPWINPSPNMRSLTEAVLYPGVGLLETTALSVGRGTDTPFEVIGAPYIHDLELASRLNRAGLPGVRFVPVQFTPKARVYKDQACKGVNIILTDRTQCNVVDIGIVCALILHELYPKEFGLDKFNRLLVHPPTVEAIRTGKSLAEIKQIWAAGLEEFKKRREPYLMYR